MEPWVDSWLAVICPHCGYGRYLTVATPEMLVGTNSTHPKSKQTVVAEVKPQDVMQRSPRSLSLLWEPTVTLDGARGEGSVPLARGMGRGQGAVTPMKDNKMGKRQHSAGGVCFP